MDEGDDRPVNHFRGGERGDKVDMGRGDAGDGRGEADCSLVDRDGNFLDNSHAQKLRSVSEWG